MKTIEHIKEIISLLNNNLPEKHKIKFVNLIDPLVLKIIFDDKNTYIEIDEKLLAKTPVKDVAIELDNIDLYNTILAFSHPHVTSPKNSFVLSISHQNG